MQAAIAKVADQQAAMQSTFNQQLTDLKLQIGQVLNSVKR